MKKERLLALAAVLVMTVGCFSGCSLPKIRVEFPSESKSTEAAETATTASATEKTAAGKKTTAKKTTAKKTTTKKTTKKTAAPTTQSTRTLREFYDMIKDSEELLDIVSGDIYSYWRSAIYDDAYDSDINVAIYAAEQDNADNRDALIAADGEIVALYKKLKDGAKKEPVRAVMDAYSAYYDFTINVDGSFNSFSAAMDGLRQDLSSTLRKLEYEL